MTNRPQGARPIFDYLSMGHPLGAVRLPNREAPVAEGRGRRPPSRPIGRQLMVLLDLAMDAQAARQRRDLQREMEGLQSRVAADLDDHLGAALWRISLQSELARQDVENRDRLLAEIGESAQEALHAMRELVWAMAPRGDDLGALLSRSRAIASRLLEPLGVSLHTSVTPEVEALRLLGEARRDLLLLLKEAITNTAKHAAAERWSLEAATSAGDLRVTIDDDGRGIGIAASRGDGGGLATMRHRAESLGGTLAVDRRQPRGTRVEIVAPIEKIAVPGPVRPTSEDADVRSDWARRCIG